MRRNDSLAKVVRSGRMIEIAGDNVLVGDIVFVSAGDIIPVDGILIEGHDLKCDESYATGESDLIEKVSGDQAFTVLEDVANGAKMSARDLGKMDPFLISGTRVLEGSGSLLTTAVGINSSNGRMLMSLLGGEPRYMSRKLDNLIFLTTKLGFGIAIIFFTVSFIKFCSTLPYSNLSPEQKGRSFLNILVVSITVSVITTALFLYHATSMVVTFAMTKMIRDNSLVRGGRAMDAIADITTICSGKTGVLTQGKMTVVAALLGKSIGFGSADSALYASIMHETTHTTDMSDVSTVEFVESLSTETKRLLIESIIVNSTAFEGEVDGRHTFVGPKIEVALMTFSRDYLGSLPSSEERHNATVMQQVPFNSQAKFMATVVRLPRGGYRVYVKGAAEIVFRQCSKVIADPSRNDLPVVDLNNMDRDLIHESIDSYARQSLRPIGLAYRDFSYRPPREFAVSHRDMTLLAIFGIQDPIREGVVDSIKNCSQARILVRMITGEHIRTARAIAEDIGLYTSPPSSRNISLEGPEFRRLSHEQKQELAPHLTILARATPEDKRIFVKVLKDLGETVAVTGYGVDDSPALKLADAGFAKGIHGTDVAKEAADVILMDDNFATITKSIIWGRAIKHGIRKFLQV
jgi:Ca2+-transporting ATPase